MHDIPLVRLPSMTVTAALDEVHHELNDNGHPGLRPVHRYGSNAVLNGHDNAGKMAPLLGMTKQGAAPVVGPLIDEVTAAPASQSL